MVVGKDSKTYPATLEPRKTHALAVAALRRQPRPLPLSCARTDYADKYAVSIRSILNYLTATYFSSLTSFAFLGDVFYVSCRFSAFPLPPSASYRRKHQTAKHRTSILHTIHAIQRTTCNGVVYGNIASYKNCR